ncbi:MAG: hypothetical protein LBF09_05865, partial [Odoribacteraceae bacterium]|nr:hypothetical protein [Odoribacteraceae bacterium]
MQSAGRVFAPVTRRGWERLIELLTRKGTARNVFMDAEKLRERLERGFMKDAARRHAAWYQEAGSEEKIAALRSTPFVETGETREDDYYNEGDPEREQRRVLIPAYENRWHYAESTDPKVKTFDSLDEAMEDLSRKGDYSEADDWYTPSKDTRVYFREVWIDRDGNEVDDTGEVVSFEDWQSDNSNHPLARVLGDDGVVDGRSFDATSDTRREVEYGDKAIPDSVTTADGTTYGVSRLGTGKYTWLVVSDATGDEVGRIRLRVADHTYNPSRNEEGDNFISVEIANTGRGRYQPGEHRLSFGNENSIDDIRDGIGQRVTEIVDGWSTGARERADRFMKAWHGSPKAFKRFSTSFMGSGEGNQAYGWGLYFTDKKGIAAAYARSNEPDWSVDNRVANKLARETLDSFGGDKDQAIAHLRSLLDETWTDKKRVRKEIKVLETGKDLKVHRGSLYEVKIHGDKTVDDLNFARWDKPLSDKNKGAILDRLRDEGVPLGELGTMEFWRGEGSFFESGDNMYFHLSRLLGGAKAASAFLSRAGVDGIQYPAEYLSRGSHEDEFNYVVFDDGAIEMLSRTRLMSTPDGMEVYGLVTPERDVYLDPDRMNANTPIHEFGHLLWSLMPEETRARITGLLKRTPGWKALSSEPAYAGLESDDEIADELFNTLLGNYGEFTPRVRAIVGEDVTLFARIQHAINEFLDWVKATLFNDTEARLNVFAKKTLGELLDGKRVDASGRQEAGRARGQTVAGQPAGTDAASEARRVAENAIMPRDAKSVSEAQELIRPLIGKPITNGKLGITATISGNSLGKLGSQSATEKSVSPALHAKAVANIDVLFERAEFDVTHPDTKSRPEIEKTHRLGSLMLDDETGRYVPVMITMLEYNDGNGNKVYTVEAIDIEAKEKPAGLMTDESESPQVPIAGLTNHDSAEGAERDFTAKMQQLLDMANSAGGNSTGDT